MRIFVTGASGHLGSVIIPALLGQGHHVVGLARSEESTSTVHNLGAESLHGDLSSLEVLHSAAAASDAVVHLALFDTDKLNASDPAGAGAAGAAAVSAMGDALVGTGKPLLGVAAVGALGELGHPASETDAASGSGPSASENVVLGLAQRGVASSVIRLPVVTHSRPRRPGLLGALIGAARRNGAVPLVEGGMNRWPATHSRDVATLFPLALQAAVSGTAGVRWHAIGEEGVAMGDIATAISTRLGVPVQDVPAGQLPPLLGFVAGLAVQDLPATSTITRDHLKWKPNGPSLLDDLSAEDFYQH